jgi:hypothetical protein
MESTDKVLDHFVQIKVSTVDKVLDNLLTTY